MGLVGYSLASFPGSSAREPGNEARYSPVLPQVCQIKNIHFYWHGAPLILLYDPLSTCALIYSNERLFVV